MPDVNAASLSLHNVDCVQGMAAELGPESIDVVITSPPYNMGIKYSHYDDTLDRDAYLKWTAEWMREVKRILKAGGSFFLNVGQRPVDPWLAFDVANVARGMFELQNTIHWIKSISIQKSDVGAAYDQITSDVSVGHYKPVNSKRFINDCHEYLFHFTHRGDVELDRTAIGVPYQDKSNIARWANAGGGLRCRGNNWFVPYKTIMKRERDRPHPATFPVELARKALALHGAGPGSWVCDPFLGIGHAGEAALLVGANFVGFEIDPAYFKEAKSRLEKLMNMDRKDRKDKKRETAEPDAASVST